MHVRTCLAEKHSFICIFYLAQAQQHPAISIHPHAFDCKTIATNLMYHTGTGTATGTIVYTPYRVCGWGSRILLHICLWAGESGSGEVVLYFFRRATCFEVLKHKVYECTVKFSRCERQAGRLLLKVVGLWGRQTLTMFVVPHTPFNFVLTGYSSSMMSNGITQRSKQVVGFWLSCRATNEH